jgi:hypothetical protein
MNHACKPPKGCSQICRMAREVLIKRLLWMAIGIAVFCVVIGVLRTLRELTFPSYSGFSFYQPLFLIPFHAAISLFGMAVAHSAAWAFRLAPITSWSSNLLVGAGYSIATWMAFLAETHLPEWLGPGTFPMLYAISALAVALCLVIRLGCSLLPIRRHT